MKNRMIDVTQMGSRVTTHEISKVESPDPVKKSFMPKVRDGVPVHTTLNLLMLGLFTMGFGFALLAALVAYGPIHKWFFKAIFAVMVVVETILCFGSVIFYKYVEGNLVEKDEKPTDTGPTKHAADLADHLTHKRHRKGGGTIVG